MKTTNREPKFWTWKDPEYLTHTEIEDAIDGFLEESEESQLPPTLILTGHAERVPNTEYLAERVLDNLLENYLDDEYGNPDDWTKPTESMKAHAKTFIESILKEYEVYMCEQVCERTVNLEVYRATGEVKEVHNEND